MAATSGCNSEILRLRFDFRRKTIVKFGLSEKHTKFEKNPPHGFDKSADLLSKRQNVKLCVLLKNSELYRTTKH